MVTHSNPLFYSQNNDLNDSGLTGGGAAVITSQDKPCSSDVSQGSILESIRALQARNTITDHGAQGKICILIPKRNAIEMLYSVILNKKNNFKRPYICGPYTGVSYYGPTEERSEGRGWL